MALLATLVILATLGTGGIVAWQLALFDDVTLPWVSSEPKTESNPVSDPTPVPAPTTDPVVELDDPQPIANSESNSVTVRSSLSEYSWEELSLIATEIESCTRSSDALSIAQDYNLVDASGRYGNATKSLQMSDGKTIRMKLVGVWHDEADTASGKAGLSFLSDGITYQHRMASGTTTPGGWANSEMRSWLQSSVYAMMPDEVSSVIVAVYKKSNNTGKTSTVSSVTETPDLIWLPSIVELCGPVDWEYDSNPANSGFYNSVFNAEGTQYEAFSQTVIQTEDTNTMFALGGEWWMRSTAASTGRGRNVGTNGDPSKFGDSNRNLGVVFGFCL